MINYDCLDVEEECEVVSPTLSGLRMRASQAYRSGRSMDLFVMSLNEEGSMGVGQVMYPEVAPIRILNSLSYASGSGVIHLTGPGEYVIQKQKILPQGDLVVSAFINNVNYSFCKGEVQITTLPNGVYILLYGTLYRVFGTMISLKGKIGNTTYDVVNIDETLFTRGEDKFGGNSHVLVSILGIWYVLPRFYSVEMTREEVQDQGFEMADDMDIPVIVRNAGTSENISLRRDTHCVVSSDKPHLATDLADYQFVESLSIDPQDHDKQPIMSAVQISVPFSDTEFQRKIIERYANIVPKVLLETKTTPITTVEQFFEYIARSTSNYKHPADWFTLLAKLYASGVSFELETLVKKLLVNGYSFRSHRLYKVGVNLKIDMPLRQWLSSPLVEKETLSRYSTFVSASRIYRQLATRKRHAFFKEFGELVTSTVSEELPVEVSIIK